MDMMTESVRMKVVLIWLCAVFVYIVQYKSFSYDTSFPMHQTLPIENQSDTVKNFYKISPTIKQFGYTYDIKKYTFINKDYLMPYRNVKRITNEDEMDINRTFNVSKRRVMQSETVKNFYKSSPTIKPFGGTNDIKKYTRINKDYFMPNRNIKGIINEDEMDINRAFSVPKRSEIQSDTVKNFYKISPTSKQFGVSNNIRKYSKISRNYFMRNRNVKNINCYGIINENEMDINRALNVSKRKEVRRKVLHNQYTEMTKNCKAFIEDRGYITHHLTEDEKTFPIAYSILMYKYVEQAERLLRAIYRPQNLYCIHIDFRTNDGIYQAMSNIANCFDNVFLTRKRIKVKWGEMSVLEPELLCMKELWRRSKTWKYFINLTGQEFPLRTNNELVQILRAYNGSNDVETTLEKNQRRWTRAKTLPPHGVRIPKGAVHVAVSQGFVNYSLHDQKARDILQWMNTSMKVPDEAYFTTLNHNPHLGVPGSYTGYPETTSIQNSTKPYLARFKNRNRSGLHNWPCRGIWIRGMCIFGIRDLPMLSQRRELFANKFHLEYQPLAYGCLEELIFNRTRDEYLGTLTFDATWYGTLGFVSNKVK